jgi:LysM repeat protein
VHSPHTVRILRTASARALIVSFAIATSLAFLAPHIAASEEERQSEVYLVQPGDTLTAIADRLGTTVEVLAELNGLTDLNHVVAGSTLTGPAKTSTQELVANTIVYVVQAGDTLWGIAESFDVRLDELAKLNGLDEDAHIIIGSELAVPGPAPSPTEPLPHREHIVAAGETLSSIAEDYGVEVSSILGLNPTVDTNLISIGQVLRIPAASLPTLSPLMAQALRDTSLEFAIDEHLLLALSLMESGWQSDIVSHTGAIGLMQLMPETARWTVAYLTPSATNWHISVEDNARVGGAYLDHLLFLEGGDIEAALASYYQGWASYKIHGMFEETRTYVDGILAVAERLRAGGV